MIGNLIREAVSGQKNTNTSGAINVEKKFILPLKRLLKDSPEKGFVAEVGLNIFYKIPPCFFKKTVMW